MVNGHETPGVSVGGSKSLSFCQCGHASFSSQILFLAVAPLSILVPLLAEHSAAGNASDGRLHDSAWM